ncbi:MAG: hypothetical protein WA937_15640 [Flavobacteriales bacterium]
MSNTNYEAQGLTKEQQARIESLIERTVGGRAQVVVTALASERFSQHYSQQLEKAKRLGKVNQLLDAWESGLDRLQPRMLQESRVSGYSRVDQDAMGRLLEQCKRDKDDILR